MNIHESFLDEYSRDSFGMNINEFRLRFMRIVWDEYSWKSFWMNIHKIPLRWIFMSFVWD